MKSQETDILIAGAGPVGLMCAHLAGLCGMRTVIVDKSEGPLEAGRADALNARTLQLFELAGLLDEIYPLGKPCRTSSVWAEGKFISRQSAWWDQLEGCLHKHFLMLGQSHVEKLLDKKLKDRNAGVRRQTSVVQVQTDENGCETLLSSGECVQSKFVIGADGSRSVIRQLFGIGFEVVRPQLIWAVLDGVIETDFPKVPEIITFQADSADVAWIPREGDIDRFYVRMDTKDFSFEDALAKINRALRPHTVRFKKVSWFSQFSVKESVADRYSAAGRVFLAGDACHIHSVNGGQGLNTGLADAFNLIWKLHLNMRSKHQDLLRSYETERKPVALSVVDTSGELVRSTKYSQNGTHAEDYVKIVAKRSGNITGMGIRYPGEGLAGSRLFDFTIEREGINSRIYSLLDYRRFTLLISGDGPQDLRLPENLNVIRIDPAEEDFYAGQSLLIRPDSYIQAAVPVERTKELLLGMAT